MNRYLIFLIGLALLGALEKGRAQPIGAPTPGLQLTLSQWKAVVTKLEGSLSVLLNDLKELRTQISVSLKETDALQAQVAKIRQSSGGDNGVFDQLRLKKLLNDLKDHLEKNSLFQRRLLEKQKELEQCCLSLISLYTERIEVELEAPHASETPSIAGPEYEVLASLVQKRHQVQQILLEYRAKKEKSPNPSINEFKALHSGDPESLQLTLDLLGDRQKSLQEENEKANIEIEEIRNEIKLQGKMREFLEGIKRMNQDSDAPVESAKRNDLSRAYGPKQTRRLESRLSELQGTIERNKATLSEIDQLTSKVQTQLTALGERKSK